MKRAELKRATPLRAASTLKARSPMTKQPAAERKARKRKCAIKECRAEFQPRSITHKTCTPECALILVEQEKAKAARKDRQAGLAKLKRRADYVKEAQAAVNAYVRERDADKPCISCGRHHEGQNHAGHFLSTGARPGLRFHEMNIHKQCQPCNVHLSGNLINYRIALINRIGLANVEMLEADDRARKWTIDELIAIKKTYQEKLKALRATRKP